MILKFHNPTTPSKRHLVSNNTKGFLRKSFLLKSKIIGYKNSSGRNNQGQITVWQKGGGHKKRFRNILEKNISMIKGIVLSVEYDPNRTANIASVFDKNKKCFFYILAPYMLKTGDILEFHTNANIFLGNRLPLSKMPVGSFFHNLFVRKTPTIAKSAGCFSILLEKTEKFCKIKLNSGEIRLVSSDSIASLGIVSNKNHFLITKGKAGRSRWLNKRPHVRGVAMNPIDHPHGGGEGKTSGGRTSVTPWGKPTKNKKTSGTRNPLIIQKYFQNAKI